MTRKKVDEVINVTNKHRNMLSLLTYKSVDTEATCRRSNLISHGIEERRNETCFDMARRFKLDIDVDRMYLVRAHRMEVVGWDASKGFASV